MEPLNSTNILNALAELCGTARVVSTGGGCQAIEVLPLAHPKLQLLITDGDSGIEFVNDGRFGDFRPSVAVGLFDAESCEYLEIDGDQLYVERTAHPRITLDTIRDAVRSALDEYRVWVFRSDENRAVPAAARFEWENRPADDDAVSGEIVSCTERGDWSANIKRAENGAYRLFIHHNPPQGENQLDDPCWQGAFDWPTLAVAQEVFANSVAECEDDMVFGIRHNL